MLEQLNRLLLNELDDHRFVTLVLVCLDPVSRTLRYASAGHTTRYLLGACGRIKAELPATGVPLGLFADARFTSAVIGDVEDGAIIALFSDGVVESIEAGQCYGTSGLLEDIRRHRRHPAAGVVQPVCAAAQACAQGPLSDDMTLVVCKVQPTATAPRPAETEDHIGASRLADAASR